MKKKYWRVVSVALTIVVILGVIRMSSEKQDNISIDNVSANKSIYQPGEKVKVTISLGDEGKKIRDPMN